MSKKYRVTATIIPLIVMLTGMVLAAQPALSYQGEEPTPLSDFSVSDISFSLMADDPSSVRSVSFRILGLGDPASISVHFEGFEGVASQCQKLASSWLCEFPRGLPLAYLNRLQVKS
jgi:hypothetical protein